jgi:hypothetical protein
MKNAKIINYIILMLVVSLSCQFSLGNEAIDVLLVGGGGEPKNNSENTFTEGLQSFAKLLESTKFNVTTAFDISNKENKEIIEKIDPQNIGFTQSDFKKAIRKIMDKIEKMPNPEGRRVLIIIDTHGDKRKGKMKTHQIGFSDEEVNLNFELPPDDSESLDQLIDLTTLAEKKKILLGIVDFSCRSGLSKTLKNSQTCVISSSGPDHLANATFQPTFFNQIKSGRSLEEVFLRTRVNEPFPTFPMISTVENDSISNDLYSLFGPYFHFPFEKADTLTEYLSVILQQQLVCKKDLDFENLLNLIQNFERLNGKFKIKYKAEYELVDYLIDYKKLQDQYLQKIKDLGAYKLDQVVKIKLSDEALELTWREILNSRDFSLLAKSYKESLPKIKDEEMKVTMRIEKISSLREEFLRDYPEVLQAKKVMRSIYDLNKEIFDQRAAISTMSNLMYDSRYREMMNANAEKSTNPCREFVF